MPVSAFNEAGVVPTGTTQFEKRGIAVNIPEWIPENCIQCNQCSMVCPHAAIRPVLIDENEEVPEGFVTKPAVGIKGAKFRIQVSPLDCTGCGVCAGACPAKQKALEMKPAEQQINEQKANHVFSTKVNQVESKLNVATVKGSQFKQPLFEFSGACAGCGETPYVKLVTQLFGDRMIVANATGCSSIYGGSAPTCPYTTNKEGKGPAWANSLFEDNAEFGYGINLAYAQRRARLTEKLVALKELWADYPEDVAIIDEWLTNKNEAKASEVASAKLVAALADLLSRKFCPKKTALLKSPFGFSAATAGHTTSATADLTTYLPAAKT